MSEPPPKKQRSLLDFFSSSDKPKKNKKEVMAAAAGGSGQKGPPAGKNNDIPGTSKPPELSDSDEELLMMDSQELDSGKQIPTTKPSLLKDLTKGRGIPLKTLDKLTTINEDLGPLKNTETHHVLFKLPFTYNGKTPPTPYSSYKDKWDAHYVKLPCSNSSEYPCTGEGGKPAVRRRWDMIQEVLLSKIPGPYEFEEKVLLYNNRYFGKWSFDVLHFFFTQELANEERNHFFNTILGKMANLALQLPHICSAPIPLLKAGKNMSITLSQQQIACLLANAFFCTFPRRNARSKTAEFSNYPNINFNTLFMGAPTKVKCEKLKCIVHYFRRYFKDVPCGTVTFTRQFMDKLPDWDNDSTRLTALHVSSEGTIEDDGDGMLQVDFANMFLGGGVLGNGCVQEEIRFLICPEMLVTRLFTESLGKNECLIMKGCERFSNYDGYAGKFEWKEDYIDRTPRDSWGRIQCEVVAIDALVIRDHKSQFQPFQVKRELNKAFCGFYASGKTKLPAVCTGNWGCGAFGGDKQLKALIQMMAAARAKRDVCYFTFDSETLRDDLYAIHQYLTTDNVLSIGDIMKLLVHYNKEVLYSHSKTVHIGIFKYIIQNGEKHGTFRMSWPEGEDDMYMKGGQSKHQSVQSHRHGHHGGSQSSGQGGNNGGSYNSYSSGQVGGHRGGYSGGHSGGHSVRGSGGRTWPTSGGHVLGRQTMQEENRRNHQGTHSSDTWLGNKDSMGGGEVGGHVQGRKKSPHRDHHRYQRQGSGGGHGQTPRDQQQYPQSGSTQLQYPQSGHGQTPRDQLQYPQSGHGQTQQQYPQSGSGSGHEHGQTHKEYSSVESHEKAHISSSSHRDCSADTQEKENAAKQAVIPPWGTDY